MERQGLGDRSSDPRACCFLPMEPLPASLEIQSQEALTLLLRMLRIWMRPAQSVSLAALQGGCHTPGPIGPPRMSREGASCQQHTRAHIHVHTHTHTPTSHTSHTCMHAYTSHTNTHHMCMRAHTDTCEPYATHTRSHVRMYHTYQEQTHANHTQTRGRSRKPPLSTEGAPQ